MIRAESDRALELELLDEPPPLLDEELDEELVDEPLDEELLLDDELLDDELLDDDELDDVLEELLDDELLDELDDDEVEELLEELDDDEFEDEELLLVELVDELLVEEVLLEDELPDDELELTELDEPPPDVELLETIGVEVLVGWVSPTQPAANPAGALTSRRRNARRSARMRDSCPPTSSVVSFRFRGLMTVLLRRSNTRCV